MRRLDAKSTRIKDVLRLYGNEGSSLLYDHGYCVGDILSQYRTLEDAQRSERLRDLPGLLAKLNSGTNGAEDKGEEWLITLAFQRVADQTADIREQSTQAFGVVGADIALVTALLVIRATISSPTLAELRGLRDLWCIPLIIFTVSAAAALVGAQFNRRTRLPDPFALAPSVAEADPDDRLTLFLAELEKVYLAGKARPLSQQALRLAFVGLVIGVIACVIVFVGVR